MALWGLAWGGGHRGLRTLTRRTHEASPRCQSPGGDVVSCVSGVSWTGLWGSAGQGCGAGGLGPVWAWGLGGLEAGWGAWASRWG